MNPTDALHKRTSHRYGWIPSLPDFRDHLATPRLRMAGPRPTVFSLRSSMPPVYDQGSGGSCTGNATAAAIDYNEAKAGRPFINPSRLFSYYNARVIEGTADSDAGASVRDIIKAVVSLGVCTENPDWPYDLSKITTQPTAKCYTDAKLNLVTNYAGVGGSSPSINDICEQLAGGEPIVFGMTVYESFESDAVANNGIVPMPGANEGIQGGHCILAVGYNDLRKEVEVRNSWGPNWGDQGYFWLPYTYIANPNLCDDFWVIRGVE